jgi:hypothetical protein
VGSPTPGGRPRRAPAGELLSEEARHLLEAKYVEGYSAKEIATG